MARDVTAQRDGHGHVFSRILQSTITWSVEFLQHGLEIVYDEPRKYLLLGRYLNVALL